MPVCLIIEIKTGELVRALILKNDLLNENFRIKRQDDKLIIPLKRTLTKTELTEIKEIDNHYQIIELDNLEKVRKTPKSHFDILNDILTEEELALVPRSFDTIGEIIVIEIPEELWDKRTIIGKALLEAHTSIKTVYAKAGKIEGVNRIRPVEYLVGEKTTRTFYREHGIRFIVDIVKAYFSPRLSEEHSRIAQKVSDGEVIADLFCGIGPFAIPIVKNTNAVVHAIDINPEAIKLLEENISLNKLTGKIHVYCGDCRKVVQEEGLEAVADRVIMNLPGYAINFVDVACKVLKPEGGIIHFFEFVGGDNPEQTIQEDIARKVKENNRKIEEILEVRKVRMSAPRQWQMVVDVKII